MEDIFDSRLSRFLTNSFRDGEITAEELVSILAAVEVYEPSEEDIRSYGTQIREGLRTLRQ